MFIEGLMRKATISSSSSDRITDESAVSSIRIARVHYGKPFTRWTICDFLGLWLLKEEAQEKEVLKIEERREIIRN